MKTAWLDCSSGISGDMFAGAIVSAGAPFKEIEKIVSTLNLKGCSVSARKVKRAGFAAIKFDVLANPDIALNWQQMERTILRSGLSKTGKGKAIGIIRAMFEAEAKVHGIYDIKKVHLHELGSPDTVIDVVSVIAGIELLGIDEIHCSSINLGSGFVKTAHGRLPVPAPATAELVRGIPVYADASGFELTTPTGAALAKGLSSRFGPMPPSRNIKTGCGAGQKEFKDSPNIFRVFVGEGLASGQRTTREKITVFDTNIDDMNPQVYGYLIEKLLASGALDAFITPIIMKKSRPAIALTVLCKTETAGLVEEIIFAETTTLGIRRRETERVVLSREQKTVRTSLGPVRVKICARAGKAIKAPEYEDCASIAREKGLPLMEVFRVLGREIK